MGQVKHSRGAGVLLVEGGNLGQVGIEDGLAELMLGADIVPAVTGLELAEGGGLGYGDGCNAHSGGC